MDEFTLIEKYFKKLTNNNPSALDLNDDVFFDKNKNVVISTDTYVAVSYTHLTLPTTVSV